MCPEQIHPKNEPRDPNDPNTWTRREVLDYREAHGENPPGLKKIDTAMFLPKIDFGLDRFQKRIKDSLGPSINEVMPAAVGPTYSGTNMRAVDEGMDRQLDEFMEENARREEEHQEDRELMREQAALAHEQARHTKQSRDLAAWAAALSAVGIIVSILIAVLT